jgi:hypothetical protein
MDELEELEDIRLYDDAKKSGEPSIPMDEAFKMIETKRKIRRTGSEKDINGQSL